MTRHHVTVIFNSRHCFGIVVVGCQVNANASDNDGNDISDLVAEQSEVLGGVCCLHHVLGRMIPSLATY